MSSLFDKILHVELYEIIKTKLLLAKLNLNFIKASCSYPTPLIQFRICFSICERTYNRFYFLIKMIFDK